MSNTPAELPGYYYDAEKKRYFAIEKSHTAPASAKWSSASVKRRKLESQAAEEASKEEELIKNSVKRNVLIHDAAASGLLAREMGSPRTAEAGRGRLENGDMAAAMWARGLTDKGSVAFEISLNYETHPHMPCFYVSGKECGTESAIAYSSFDDEMLMGIYIETDENENLKTRSAAIRQSGKPHYEMVYCPQMSSIKYHQPTNKVLLTSKQYGENRSLCVFTPPMETSPDLGLHWDLGEINSYRNIMNDFSQNSNWGVNQSTPAPASSNLLCVVGTNKGIQRIHLNETPSWITQTATPPNYGHDARIDYPGCRTYFGPQEIFSQDFQVGNHNILLAGGRQHRLWITDLRAPAAGWSFVKYGSSIAHVRSINSHQVLVAGEKKKSKPHPLNFSALHLLHDPQEFADQLFTKHLQSTKNKLSLDTKLLVLQLITRLVGLHKLTIVPLYSWFIKYLTPKQQSVTSILASLAQGVHNLVPPDALEPLIQKIANEFVSEASASEVAAVGLNAIREICSRQSLAMTETLLQDLVQYRKSKDKGVMMAAKGLLSLYREVGAEMLKKRDRGKDAAMGLSSGLMKQRKFGEEEVGGIEGLDLLAKWKEEQRKRKRAEKGLPEDGSDASDDEKDKDEDGFNSDEWEVGSEDSSDSGEWINVEHSSDEDEPAPKKRKGEEDGDEDNAEDEAAELERMTKLATTTILTPADLAKLQELRAAASVQKAMGGKFRKRQQQNPDGPTHADDGLTAENIEAPIRLRKLTKEEKVALAKEGKPDRDEHKSTQAIRKSKKDAAGKSTSNREKQRKKNFLMTLGKAKSKQKRSLIETRKVLKGHVERSTRGGRRRNGT